MKDIHQTISSDLADFVSRRAAASANGSTILDRVSGADYDGVFGFPPFVIIDAENMPLGYVASDGSYLPLPYGFNLSNDDVSDEYSAIFSFLSFGAGILRFVPVKSSINIPDVKDDILFENRIADLPDEFWRQLDETSIETVEQVLDRAASHLGRFLARSFDLLGKEMLANSIGDQVELPDNTSLLDLQLTLLTESPLMIKRHLQPALHRSIEEFNDELESLEEE
jgi:hypothetical protein